MRFRFAAKASFLAGIGALWVASLTYGFWQLRVYESTPGAMLSAPASWPAVSTIPRRADMAQLVMFVHPECSCTNASLEELSSVLQHLPGAVAAWIVIEGDPPPDGAAEYTNALKHLAHVSLLHDPRGLESHLFGALTSGHTVLYDPSGRLQFSGGITGARGHIGDNWGATRLVDAATHPGKPATTHNVYGCPL